MASINFFDLNQDVPYCFIEDRHVNADTAYIVLDIDIFGVGGAGGEDYLRFMIYDFQGIRRLQPMRFGKHNTCSIGKQVVHPAALIRIWETTDIHCCPDSCDET